MALTMLTAGTALLFIFRYLRLLINLISHWTFTPTPIPLAPSYSSRDVTVIIPTIAGDGQELRRTIRACIATDPAEVIVVTVQANMQRALAMADEINTKRIRVMCVPRANKRRQMCAAIPLVETRITVFADDDVIWPTTLMPWLLAPFEEDKVGAVGTSQRLVRPDKPTLWTFLGSLYLERRNFDCSACLNMDGGLPCLSGRTVAYRSSILQGLDFTHAFTHEKWGSYLLNADDDNFITRYVLGHGWKIAMQYHKAAEVQTTLENGPLYLKQCLRWVRSNWRSNITSMFVEKQYWWTHPWTTYAVFQTTFTAWAFCDILLFHMLYRATQQMPSDHQRYALIAGAIWIFVFAKTVKLLGHFIRFPVDILLLPVSVLFGHCHGIIKIIGLCTLSETAWGSREGADIDDQDRMISPPQYATSTATESSYANASKGLQASSMKLPSYRSSEALTMMTAIHLYD